MTDAPATCRQCGSDIRYCEDCGEPIPVQEAMRAAYLRGLEDAAQVADELKPCPFCGCKTELRKDGECAYIQCLGTRYHRVAFVDDGNAAAPFTVPEWNDRQTERAAYLRGLEDAAQVADGYAAVDCDNEDDLEDFYIKGWTRSASRVSKAIRALAKEGGNEH